eukprot:g9701.t1
MPTATHPRDIPLEFDFWYILSRQEQVDQSMRQQLLGRCANCITAMYGTPTTMGVDDVHWAGTSSVKTACELKQQDALARLKVKLNSKVLARLSNDMVVNGKTAKDILAGLIKSQKLELKTLNEENAKRTKELSKALKKAKKTHLKEKDRVQKREKKRCAAQSVELLSSDSDVDDDDIEWPQDVKYHMAEVKEHNKSSAKAVEQMEERHKKFRTEMEDKNRIAQETKYAKVKMGQREFTMKVESLEVDRSFYEYTDDSLELMFETECNLIKGSVVPIKMPLFFESTTTDPGLLRCVQGHQLWHCWQASSVPVTAENYDDFSMCIPSKLMGGGVPMGQTAGHVSTFRVRTKYPMAFKNDTPLDCFFDGVEEKLSLCLADQGEKATDEELQEGEEDILQDLKKAEDGFLEENTVSNRLKNGSVTYGRAELYPAIWGEYVHTHSTSVFNGGELKHPSEKDAQELESKNLAYWGVIASEDPDEDMFFQQLEFDAQMPGRYAASMLEHNRKKTDRIIDHIQSKALFTSSGGKKGRNTSSGDLFGEISGIDKLDTTAEELGEGELLTSSKGTSAGSSKRNSSKGCGNEPLSKKAKKEAEKQIFKEKAKPKAGKKGGVTVEAVQKAKDKYKNCVKKSTTGKNKSKGKTGAKGGKRK